MIFDTFDEKMTKFGSDKNSDVKHKFGSAPLILRGHFTDKFSKTQPR
jgi:hypothetical protein